MKSRIRLAAAGAAVVTAAAFVAPAFAAAEPSHGSDDAAHAVFVQTNDTAGNAVIAYHRNADGSLGDSTSYPTGGAGGRVSGAVVDPLASQGSLVYDGAHRLLFAVNAGSDSVSVFGVEGDRLSLRQTVSSGGDFPVSIGVHDDLVYVLDALGGGSVSGYRLAGGRLHAIPGSTRPLDLPGAPSPDKTFLYTPGQVGFTPDGSQLVVTTKASTSSIDVFSVGRDGRLSDAPVANTSAAPVPFGFVFDPAGRLVVGEAGGSVVSTYAIGADGTVTHVGSQADNQAALCWIAAVGGSYYAANAGSGSVSGYRVDEAGQPSLIVDPTFATPGVVATTDGGTVDLIGSPDGRFLYVETGAHGTVGEYRVNANGTLTPLGTVTGLPATVMEGIAAS